MLVALVSALSTLLAPGAVGVPASRVMAAPSRAASDITIVWIVLDEAPLWPLLGTDGRINARRWPGFASLASVSTWYRDTKATAQWTYFAVPSLLDGVLPTFTKKPIFADHPRNVFTALAGAMSLDVQETMTRICPSKLCPPRWRPPINDVKGYVTILEQAVERAADAVSPSFHFVHTVFPHRPWVMAPDLRFSAKNTRDTRSERLVDRKRDIYQSHLRQYLAADAEIGAAVSRLEASPNWDRMMLVVTADHGLTFAPGESIRDRVNRANPGSMEDIFTVPLFIKYPGQTRPSVKDCTVSSVDILPTVLGVAGVKTSWKLDGVDLSSRCPARESRRVRWPRGYADMTTRFPAILERVRWYDSWISANGDADGIYRIGLSGKLVGTRVPDSAPREKSIRWKLDHPEVYRRVGSGRFAAVPVRTTGRFRTSRALSSTEEGLVVIDGTIVGVAGEMNDVAASAEDRYFSSSILTRVLAAGDHRVELWLVDWKSGSPVFRRVGGPNS